MRSHSGFICAALLLVPTAGVHAEYCVSYSSGVMSLARQAGSSRTSSCFPTEAQCNNARWSRPGDFAGICLYQPGLYPPTQSKSGSSGTAPADQTAKDSAAAQKKIQAQERAEREAADRAAQQAGQDLLGGLKGVDRASGGITIKLPPPTTGKTRAQLDCVTRASAASTREDAARLGPGTPGRGPQDDFQNAEDCRPVTPGVPEPPTPTPTAVEPARDPALLARLLESLLARQREVQQQLVSQDREITRLEAEVAREEQVPKVELKTAPAESDALRRAREALAKARADRQKTAAEYARLQQEAQQARQQQAAP